MKIGTDKRKEQLPDLEQLANKAFLEGNYAEAFSYYEKVLETSAENPLAIFRRGLCAGYLSLDAPVLRIGEVLEGYRNATFRLTGDTETLSGFTREYIELAKKMGAAYKLKSDDVFNGLYDMRGFTRRYENMLRGEYDMCSLIPLSLGQQREEFLKIIVEICSYSSRKYYCSSSDKISSGQIRRTEVLLEMPEEVRKFALSVSKQCKADYYALPNVQQELAGLDTEIAFHSRTTEEYKKAYENFIGANPQYKKQRRHIRVWGTLAVSFLTLIICSVFILISILVSPWTLIAIPASILIAYFVWQRMSREKLNELDERLMPAALVKMREEYIESRKSAQQAEKRREEVKLR